MGFGSWSGGPAGPGEKESAVSGSYDLAPEFAAQPSFTIPSNRLALRVLDLLVRLQRRGFDAGDDVQVETHVVRVGDGHDLQVLEIAPRDLAGAAPALLDYHGGGFFLSCAKGHLDYAVHYARAARCRVFLPDYRLSIGHPFPAALDDCYATLAWVHGDAERLAVDPERVVLIGDSAGGALAAGVAQRALDHGECPIRAQVLIYPVTDHETKSDSARAFTDTPMWRTASNRNMWKVYLRGTEYGRTGGASPVPRYAAPLHREDFAGLPSARVEVAQFDPLRDEGLAYARALQAAGVPVELREVRGGIHGYDLVEGSPTARLVLGERMDSIRRFLSESGAPGSTA
jgi:acetyl esterase/lipase